MSHRFVRCPHCKMPHDAAERICPTTGRRIEPAAGVRPRMTELPPPERKPEPLGFDAARHRFAAEREAEDRSESLQRPSTATLNPTHNLQTDLIGRTVSDRYIIKGILGEGGMGTVYEAEHMGLGRQVAIKVLSPSQAKKRVAVKRFQQEARAAGAIGHPNICEVYDLGLLDDGSPYLVMEKLIGTTLADRILREGGLPFDEIADVMIQVLSGLIAAHDKGIVHRDIKPENIFLARRVGCPPIVKILDFGVSKMMPQFQGGDEQLDLTRTGMVMGTPYYMSPEQARGERNLDGRVDVYACGVMMYESIVGKRPFLAPNYNALLLSIINTTPKPLREIRPATPPALDAIVLRSMAKARDDRYLTANAVLRDIQALPIVTSAAQVNRMPPPPTAEERMRAPVLGGRPPASTREGDRERVRDRADEAARSTRDGRRAPEDAGAAGATLRSRMNDAQPPARGGENATRLDIKVRDVRSSLQGHAPQQTHAAQSQESDAFDIPIHITGSDLIPVQEPTPPPYVPHPATRGNAPPAAQTRGPVSSSIGQTRRSAEYVDEMPTEIFRPGMHPQPPPRPVVSRSPSATRIAPAPDPRRAAHVAQAEQAARVAQAQAARAAQAQAAQAAQPLHPAQSGMAPVDFSGLVGDDWDGETVVKKPAMLTTSRHRDRHPASGAGHVARQAPPQGQPPAPPPRGNHHKPFNPDETVVLHEDVEVEVDFSDDATHNLNQNPRRR